jgi:dyslexia susceptibility 1 candidate gene 1 protein
MPKPIPKPEGEPDEDHPLWLKDKGNTFFANEDYESAINAYTQGLKADNKNIVCLLNRSAAYLKIYELDNALKDIEAIEST